MSSDLGRTSNCRTCLSQDTKYQLSDSVEEENVILLDMLNGLVPQIHIAEQSHFSHCICQICVEKLLIGYKFQQLCIETDKRLHCLKDKLLCGASIENDLKPQEMWDDPLREEEQVSVMKLELDDVESNGCGVAAADNVEVIIKCDNDVETDAGGGGEVETGGSYTDSSNEKLSVLRERKLRISKRIGKSGSKNTSNGTDHPCYDCNKIFRCLSRLNSHRCVRLEKISKRTRRAEHRHKEKKLSNLEKVPQNELAIEDNVVLPPQRYEDDVEESCNDNDNKDVLDLGHETSAKENITETTKSVDILSKDKETKEKPNKNLGIFPCDVCDMVFDRAFRLKRHRSVHSTDKPYACEICNRRFFSAKYLKIHQMKHINQQLSMDDFPCPYCPSRFDNLSSLKIHRKTHKKTQLPKSDICEICKDSSFKTTKSLIQHIKTEHPEAEKQLICDHCKESFFLQSQLVKHLKQRHKDNTNLFCNICEKDFKYKSALEKHMRSHNGERPYLCPQCGKTFRSSSNLSEHVTRHSGLPNYPCPECPRRFKCGSDLRKHATTHSNLKKHVCDICGFRFTRAYSLQEHKRLHTGERPFKCEQCGKSFAILYHLKRHIRTHTGEKPYKCTYCERAYAVGGDLTKHLRIHLGEKTYLCTECPQAFKYNSELRKHLIEHYKMSKSQESEKQQDETIVEAEKDEELETRTTT